VRRPSSVVSCQLQIVSENQYYITSKQQRTLATDH
jgi:hypothetical protein